MKHERHSVQFSRSVMSDSLRPHEPQHSRPPCPPTPGVTQTHVHWVVDAIQPSHPLSSPSPLALNLSQRQGLFKWVSSSHQVAKVLEFQLQHQNYYFLSNNFAESNLNCACLFLTLQLTFFYGLINCHTYFEVWIGFQHFIFCIFSVVNYFQEFLQREVLNQSHFLSTSSSFCHDQWL